MQKKILSFSALLVTLLFLGSLVVAHEGTVNFQGTENGAAVPTLVRRAPSLTATNPVVVRDDADISSDGTMVKGDPSMEMELKIKSMFKSNLGVELTDEDVKLLSAAGVSTSVFKGRSMDEIKAIILKLRANSSALVHALDMEKEQKTRLDAIKADQFSLKNARSEKQRQELRIKLFTELAEKISNPVAKARIQAQLARLTASATNATVADVKSKVDVEVKAVRQQFLLDRATKVKANATLILSKIDSVLTKLTSSSQSVTDADAKAKLADAITRLTTLKMKFSEQMTALDAATAAFTADPSLDNAKALNKVLVMLKVYTDRIIHGVRALRIAIGSAKEGKNDVVMEQVDSIEHPDEVSADASIEASQTVEGSDDSSSAATTADASATAGAGV